MAVAPVVAATDDPAVAGSPCLIVHRIEGETIARRIQRDDRFAAARPRVVAQSAEALARTHAIALSDVPHLRAADPLGPLVAMLDSLGEPHPALEMGIRWLERHRPPERPPTVVHGDFRLGTLVVAERGLAAVLDWELAHAGDPVEDLGWFCVRAWRFGGAAPVAGLGSYEELIEAYVAAGGDPVAPATLRWWETLGALRWGVICVLQASTHLSGISRSVELAAIGRRVCETESDLLDLLDVPPAPPPTWTSRPASERQPPHDRPTAAELVEAVREFLERDVLTATEGRVQFHTRVAVNVLGMVERELAEGGAAEDAHRADLAALGLADDAGLAAAIRSGSLDDRWAEVSATVRRSVAAKLATANPSY